MLLLLAAALSGADNSSPRVRSLLVGLNHRLLQHTTLSLRAGDTHTLENLRAALQEMGSFDVVGGKISFREDGTVRMPIEINRISGGESEVLETVELTE